MSNLRVSVEWQNAAVFAGESVESVITFRNTARKSESKSPRASARNECTTREMWKDTNSAANTYQTTCSTRSDSSVNLTKGHRDITSLNRFGNNTTFSPVATTPCYTQPHHAVSSGRHRRSISIVSIGASPTFSAHRLPASRTKGKGHGRAASLQLHPGESSAPIKSPTSAIRSFDTTVSVQNSRQASRDINGGTAPLISTSPTSCVLFSKATSGEPSVKLGQISQSRTSSTRFTGTPKISQFQYPPLITVGRKEREPSTTKLPPSAQDQQSQVLDARSYMAKVFTPTNNEGTPRSSTDLYSISDDSSDTLESVFVHPGNGSTLNQSIPRHERSPTLRSESRQAPEVLMMGFGNIVGKFSLDPSLVDPSPFDEVRNKAVVGNQGGGGVVRAGSTKNQNGLLGFLGWNALGASLGDLLAGNEISSIKEASKSKNAQCFPILSTPQSLLFTNLRLEPGESQSYTFSYRLPPGLPPTYKGKALKVSYNIILGIQRATQLAQQHIVRSVDFPFRVLPSINGMAKLFSDESLMTAYRPRRHNKP